MRNMCKEVHCCGHAVDFTEDLLKKLWHIQTVESHVVMKKNEKNPYVPTLNNARDINEKSKILPQYASYNSLCVEY